MSPKRIFRLAYPTSQSDNLRFRIHQLRDGDAFVQLSPVLYSDGYEFGGLVLNLTSDEVKAPALDVTSLNPSDLLVLNTRPPLDDDIEEDKKRVQSSHTALEDRVFIALKTYFDKCARSRVTLSQTIAQQLADAFKERADITFREYTKGSYMKYRAYGSRFWQKPRQPNLTALYLVRIPAIWHNGPGLLAAFGMAGAQTLAWNYILRTRFPEWVTSYQFIMAEVEVSRLPQRPTDLSFADTWKVKPILQVPFHSDP